MAIQKGTKLLFAVLLMAVVLNTPGFAKPKRKCKHEKDTSKEVSKESEESKEYDDDYTTSTTTATTTTSPTTTSPTTPNPCEGCEESTQCCFAGVQCRIRPRVTDDCGVDYCPCLESTCVDGVCQA
ncbi:integumentary mucin C.1-like [Pomacea canaliculata]|uniref:integumentary mucin C.1-like n=1 Tax=Pomacea canaliculata TaxID=400727 RepID=UPI000D73AC09|nr:integumentary mucin C.1-like [Pomacea canaliculata]